MAHGAPAQVLTEAGLRTVYGREFRIVPHDAGFWVLLDFAANESLAFPAGQ